MTDTTAQIAAKGCTSTGITEHLAEQLHSQLGRKVVAVVELVSEARSERRDGKEKVSLSILTIEPAPTPETEDHLRELARAFHYERKLTEDGPQLLGPDDGPEPKVADVINQGKGVLTTRDGEPRLITDDDPDDAETDQFLLGDNDLATGCTCTTICEAETDDGCAYCRTADPELPCPNLDPADATPDSDQADTTVTSLFSNP